MKKIFISFFLIVLTCASQGQTMIKDNAIGYQEPTTAIVDQTIDTLTGEVYYFGTYSGALVINGEVKAPGRGGTDLYVAKTDALGNLLWYKTYGSVNDDFGNTLISDNAHMIHYSSGFLYLTLNKILPNGSFDEYINSSGENISLFVKIDPSIGKTIWYHTANLNLQNIYEFNGDFFLHAIVPNSKFDFKYDQILLKDTSLLSPGEFRSFPKNIFIKTDASGNMVWRKQIATTKPGGMGSLLIKSTDLDKFGFFNFVIDAEGDSLKFGAEKYLLPGDGSKNQFVLVKVDTGFTDVAMQNIYFFKYATPTYQNTAPNLNFSVNSKNSYYLLLEAPSSCFFTFKENYFSMPAQSRALLEIDKSFNLKKFSILNRPPTPGTLNSCFISNMAVSNDNLFFYVNYIGKNNSSVYQSPIKNIQPRNIFLDFKDSIELNGPNKNYIIKTSLDLTNLNVLSMGDGERPVTRTAGSTISFLANSKCYLTTISDRIWNPWIIDENNQVIKGKINGMADLAETPNGVYFFADGSRLIYGIAQGYTLLDDKSNLLPNQTNQDLFFARVSPGNEILWYRRSASSFNASSFRSVKMIDNEVYFLINAGGSKSSSLGNTFILDNKAIVKDNPNVAGLPIQIYIKVGIDGILEFREINIFQGSKVLNNDKNSIFNFGTSNYQVIGTKTDFSNLSGTYVTKFDPILNRQIDGIKIEPKSPTTNTLEVQFVQYDSTDGNYFIVAKVTGYNQSFRIQYGNNRFQDFTVANKYFPGDDYIYIKYATVIIKTDFNNGISWIKELSPGLIEVKSVEYLGSKLILNCNKKQGDLYFNDTAISHGETYAISTPPMFSYLLSIDANGNYQASKNFNSTSIGFQKSRTVSNRLFLSGSNNAAASIDSLPLGFNGVTDAITLELDETLTPLKLYRIASIYRERMIDCDVFNNQIISFAYVSQGSPSLVQGNEYIVQSLNKNVKNDIASTLFRSNISPVSLFASSAGSLANINPADLQEDAKVALYNLCIKKKYYADKDGDGFGDPFISAVECSAPVGYVENNTDCDDTEKTNVPCPCPTQTYAETWMVKLKSNTLSKAWFDKKFPASLVIGGTKNPNNKVVFTSIDAIQAYLPGNGKTAQLNTSFTNPTAAQLKNSFVSQLLFLRLNMAYNPGLKIATIASGTYSAWTIQRLWDFANERISDNTNVSKEELAVLVDAIRQVNHSVENGINNSFVVCGNTNNLSLNASGFSNISFNNKAYDLMLDIKVLPNPSHGSFYLKNNGKQSVRPSLMTNLGQSLVEFRDLPAGSSIQFGEELSPGIYYLRIQYNDGGVKTLKIIKH